MAKEKSVFKNAVGGYQKKEVNEYIAALAGETARREALYETEKGKLERALSDAAEEKEQLCAVRDELACSLFEAEENGKRKDAELAELRRKNEELAASLAAQEMKVKELEAALAEKTDGTDESAFLEGLSDKVEKIMNAAGGSAKEIVEKALHRADEIVSEAKKKAELIRREATVRSETLTERAKDTYETAATYYDGVTRFANELRESLEKLTRDIGEKKTDVKSKIEWLRFSEASASPTEEPSAEETESDAGKVLSSLDEKLEEFFRSTLSAIREMTEKEKEESGK